MSRNRNKLFNQSMTTQMQSLQAPTTFNLWGPVRYPKNLTSQTTYQLDFYERCIAITIAAVFLIAIGIMTFILCSMRRRYYQIHRRDPKLDGYLCNGGGTESEKFNGLTRPATASKKMKQERTHEDLMWKDQRHFQALKQRAGENGTPEMKTLKDQMENNSIEETKSSNICLKQKIDEGNLDETQANERCKADPQKFRHWTTTLFEHEPDAITSV